MKSIFALCAFVLLSLAAQAQTYPLTSSTGYSVDTVTNTGVKTQKISVKSYAPAGLIQVVVDKISGTVGGKVLLFGSVDGTNYVQIKTDSLVAGNVTTQTKIFDVSPVKYPFYQVSYTGTGTMAAKLRSSISVKK